MASKRVVIGPERCGSGSVCIDCKRVIHGNTQCYNDEAPLVLLQEHDGCPYCGRVVDLYLAPLVQAREYAGCVILNHAGPSS